MLDYSRGYLAGVAACNSFLIKAHDLPTVAEDMRAHVLPNRQWLRRMNRRLIREGTRPHVIAVMRGEHPNG